MTKCTGLTETIWTKLPEEKKLFWRYFARFAGFIGGYFVLKTGNFYFDLILGLLTTLFLIIVIETQRSYSKISPAIRKKSLRVAIKLGSSGILVLGIAFFFQEFLLATASVWIRDVSPALKNGVSVLVQITVLLCFVAAIPLALVRFIRELNVRELIYDFPLRGMKQLLVYKGKKADSFQLFVVLELSALVICLLYASAVAIVAKGYFRLFEIVKQLM